MMSSVNVILEVGYAIAYRTNTGFRSKPCYSAIALQSVKVTCNKHSHLISLILFLRLYVTQSTQRDTIVIILCIDNKGIVCCTCICVYNVTVWSISGVDIMLFCYF